MNFSTEKGGLAVMCWPLRDKRKELKSENSMNLCSIYFYKLKGSLEEDSFEYIRRHFKIADPEKSSGKGEKLIKEIKENANSCSDLRTESIKYASSLRCL